MTRRAVILVCLGLAAVAGLSQLPKLGSAVRSFTLPLNHASIIREQAADKNLSPALVAAVIYAETVPDPRVLSVALPPATPESKVSVFVPAPVWMVIP